MLTATTQTKIAPEKIRHAIEHASHLLPAQGPITVFIHHNTLHGLEHLSFEEAVRQAARIFGCRPYLSEDRYRQEMAKGRIHTHDISTALLDSLGEEADLLVGFLGTRYHLRRAMLRHPLHSVLPNQLDWVIAENQSFEKFSCEALDEKPRLVASTQRWVTRFWNKDHRSQGDLHEDHEHRLFREVCRPLMSKFKLLTRDTWNDSLWESFTLNLLWQICLRSVSLSPNRTPPHCNVRHRDFLLDQTGTDADMWVNELLIRFGVAMLDQGLSRWHLPDRELGWFAAFIRLYASPELCRERWLRKLVCELKRIESLKMTPLNSIQESLELLDVQAEDLEPFVEQTFLALRGFAGMIRQMEVRSDRIAHGMKPDSLTEFLAVRLILDRLAIEHIATEFVNTSESATLTRSTGTSKIRPVSLQKLKATAAALDSTHRPVQNIRSEAFAIFQLAQSLGWLPESLFKLTSANWRRLLEEIRLFDEIERQKIFHLAFERRYRQQSLDALRIHALDARPAQPTVRTNKSDSLFGNDTRQTALFDVVTCIDDREESFRRHLEEVEPSCRTWGCAGFFGVAMYYCAADSFQYVPLCPIVIEPKHYVQELVTGNQAEVAQRRSTLRRVVGKTQGGVHAGSRSLIAGAMTSVLGVWMTVPLPLVARVLFPRLAARFRWHVDRLHELPTQTTLHLERQAAEPGIAEHQLGFSLDEMAAIVARVLCDIGMANNWSRLVIVVGHGSTTMNNPHESAYDCGACGGGRGGPNARAFTQMANDPRVRSRLHDRGLVIPDSTCFLGAFHNTCSDQVSLLDVSRVPPTHLDDVANARRVLSLASQRNAHERSRRFESASLNFDTASAFRHVHERSEDLSQVRPELGHATNALCVVGRRELTRGLYLDRRAFLHSYDPEQDDAQHSILAGILSAVFPVCGGINLEYYFSHVDPEGYGCGTKLPHNIAALVGVMNGAASDLRTGLPWQMVEIHEPIRLLIVVESTPDAMNQIIANNPNIARMALGGWVQLATLQADQRLIHCYQRGRFVEHLPESDELAQVPSSIAWYQGLRSHLDFAQIGKSSVSDSVMEGAYR